MFTSNVLDNKCFRKMKHVKLWKNVILWAISRREISPLVVIFLKKKNDQPSWRTTRRNYKHLSQIVCISSRFRVLLLLSWEFERSGVLWGYTAILVCHLKHVKSADLHETILTPVICHKHVRYHVGVTLYFSVKFLSVAPKTDICIYVSRFPRTLN